MTQIVKNPPARRETWVWSLGWEYRLEEGMATHSSILAWRIPIGRGTWYMATVHGIAKSRSPLSNFHTLTRIDIASSTLAVSSVISNPLLNSASEFKILVLSLFFPPAPSGFWDLSSPYQSPWQWKLCVLTAGYLGNFPKFWFLIFFYSRIINTF